MWGGGRVRNVSILAALVRKGTHPFIIALMQPFVRGVLGLGVTLLVVASAMMTVNGLGRGWAAHRLAKNPNDSWGGAVVLLL
jgi:hypothetical protein